MEEETSRITTVRLTIPVRQAIEEYAKREHRTISSAVNHLLYQALIGPTEGEGDAETQEVVH